MTDQAERGGVVMEFPGAKLTCRYTTRSILAMQKALGVSTLPEVLAILRSTDATGNGDLDALVTIIWAGYVHLKPPPDRDMIADLLADMPTLLRASEVMSEALTAFMRGPAGLRDAEAAEEPQAGPQAPPEASQAP